MVTSALDGITNEHPVIMWYWKQLTLESIISDRVVMKLSIILPCKYNYCICIQNCSSLSVCILNSHIDTDYSQKWETCAQGLEVLLGKERKEVAEKEREGEERRGGEWAI